MTATRRHIAAETRAFDHLYDSTYIVTGARDYARTSFKAAMGNAQLIIQPVYRSMFSVLRRFPSKKHVYYSNCRLPPHVDGSYRAYLSRLGKAHAAPAPLPVGRDQYMFVAVPKPVLPLNLTTPDFHPPSPLALASPAPTRPRNRGTQSRYRESSAQTNPWQPDGKAAEDCENTPEVLYLDKLQWGPGDPYRIGDLPADFHTTEIINKMRHARAWTEVAEKGNFPRWMKHRDEIIEDIETKDWIFREAEIDELQDIRLSLLHKLQTAQRNKLTSKTGRKLAARWEANKQQMEAKISSIRRARDREIRKLSALHTGGGRAGLVQRMRASRAMGSTTIAACDPTSDLHASVARHGYQARCKHAVITYNPELLQLEDHKELTRIPEWLVQCGQNLKRTCSGHQLPRDPTKLCERETKWSEEFLANLHSDLRKARLGAAAQAGPLHVMRPRVLHADPRPATPQVEAVPDADETNHQAALVLQKVIRGRAVQCLMYEGRTRAAELTEELKTTHGLQKEDRERIAREEERARDYRVQKTEAERKEDAVQALVDELCGGAVSAALDFLEKELRRLKEERRQHAYILIALREKQMREAAEAGRRQKEEHRRREHDEMFKQILGVTQETVDSYLQAIVQQGTALGSELEAVRRAEMQADKIEEVHAGYDAMSTAEQNELVAELVHQFLLPEAHKTAAKHRIAAMQAAKLEAARKAIFGLLDEARKKTPVCAQCGVTLGEACRCKVCPGTQDPVATEYRADPRWKYTTSRPRPPEIPAEDRFPPHHQFRCMLNEVVDEVVERSRRETAERDNVRRDVSMAIRTQVEIGLDMKYLVEQIFNVAMGVKTLPARKSQWHFYSTLTRPDALERTESQPPCPCPRELPSTLRRIAEEQADEALGRCACLSPGPATTIGASGLDYDDPEQRRRMLPSELRVLEELRRCKCDLTYTSGGSSSFGIDAFDSVSWIETPHDQEQERRPEE